MESGGDKRRVVIVGGGIAGSLLAKSIQFNADVTLIDPKEYLEIIWANLRNMVEPSFAERSVINHRDYLTNGLVVTSAAINITDTEVLTAEGRLIGYDYLVIATGHYDPVPKTKEERLNQYQAENQKIQSANSILIVGGGPTGVELAGEIATDFPEKKITLVHKGPRLLEFIGLKAGDKALRWLKSRNVEVKLEQEVDLKSIPDGTKVYQTSMGETIEADCRFLCAGKPLATSWLCETILKDNLDKRGRLMVDEYLRVKGHKNIFAIGDITDVPVLMSGGKESKMSTYEPGSAIAMVSLGRKDAIAQFPFTTIGGCVPGYVKSRDFSKSDKWGARVGLVLAGCFPGHATAAAAQSRKMLLQAELKENNEVMNMKSTSSLDGSKSISGHGENSVGWEMRTVPSGPDPLHHNGGSPKKPRVDP
ncbi:FAD-dependent pyridine nucleotide-disulfide oxidoreductase [Corchorus capsularis]|uniref:FAD-dependent pyridine nucleotide-disulfide oxidoreductase n=1 Tax=Corchorus capsularis TaxID=210143 RepID=A0A1R3JLA3_COCAP|nr:FAD-dependent pyridine nucleotide-disulfide oxidoreductase [Corchorus capsularis]